MELQIETGRYLKRTEYPLYRVPVNAPSIIDNVSCGMSEVKATKLFNLDNDYAVKINLAGVDHQAEEYCIKLLDKALDEHEAPAEQKQRLGLKD